MENMGIGSKCNCKRKKNSLIFKNESMEGGSFFVTGILFNIIPALSLSLLGSGSLYNMRNGNWAHCEAVSYINLAKQEVQILHRTTNYCQDLRQTHTDEKRKKNIERTDFQGWYNYLLYEGQFLGCVLVHVLYIYIKNRTLGCCLL